MLHWPACSPELSAVENIWHIVKCKNTRRRPRTVELLESYIRKEWDNIPLTKVQQLVSSVPPDIYRVFHGMCFCHQTQDELTLFMKL